MPTEAYSLFSGSLVYRLDFQCDLDRMKWRQTLSADERARADRFKHFPSHRAFVLTRLALRRLLGEAIRLEPHAVEFDYNARGKPSLRQEPALHFNVSHSGDCGLIALAWHTPLGVDVESIRETDWDALAKRFYSKPEYAFLQAQPNPLQAFYTLWTYKEAYIKALGEGLAYGLNRFAVDIARGRLDYDEINKENTQVWRFHPVLLHAPYIATLSYPSDQPPELRPYLLD